MSADVLGWVIWFVAAAFVSYTYRLARREVLGGKRPALEQCQANIRRMETEIYGAVLSASLVRDEDIAEHDAVAERIRKELTPVRVRPVPSYMTKQQRAIALKYMNGYKKSGRVHSSKNVACVCRVCLRESVHHYW